MLREQGRWKKWLSLLLFFVKRLAELRVSMPTKDRIWSDFMIVEQTCAGIIRMYTWTYFKVADAHLYVSLCFWHRRRGAVYSRYTVCDWDAAAKMQFDLAKRESKRSQQIDVSSWQMLNGLEQRMINRQCSNSKKLGQLANRLRVGLPN